jgi:hypothetical protein
MIAGVMTVRQPSFVAPATAGAAQGASCIQPARCRRGGAPVPNWTRLWCASTTPPVVTAHGAPAPARIVLKAH